MSERKKDKIVKILYTAITLICVLFIYSQSILPASKSGAESGRVVEWLNYICEQLNLQFTFTNYIVRKLAHFTEFAFLGFSMYFTMNLYVKKKIWSALFCVFGYIFVAVTDECIQLLSEGRACSFKDMLLDISGSTFGLLIAIILSFMISKFKTFKKRGA